MAVVASGSGGGGGGDENGGPPKRPGGRHLPWRDSVSVREKLIKLCKTFSKQLLNTSSLLTLLQ